MEQDEKLCLRCACRKLDGDEPHEGCVDCVRLNTSLKQVVYGKAVARKISTEGPKWVK